MARSKGFQGICAVKKATTWGTAVAGGATDGVEVISLETPGNTELIEDMQITGNVTARESDAGTRTVDVTLKTALRYEGLERLIALTLGTAGAPTTVDTTGRRHAIKIANQIDGIFSTVAFELMKDTTIIEVPSVKWNAVTLRCAAGGRAEIEFKGIGDDWKDNSAINTTTTIDTVTLPTNREYAVFGGAVVRANAQAGGALAAGDVVYCSEIEVTIERAMDRIISTERGNKTSEPIESGFLKVSGTLTFPVYQSGTGGNSAFAMEQMAATKKKIDIQLVSTTLAGSATEFYAHRLYLPMAQFGEGKPSLSGPGAINWALPFNSHHVGSAPTGFTAGYTGACTWEVTSQLVTDPLA